MSAPIRIAIIGMGGFAGSHHRTLARIEELGQVRLVAACDPEPDRYAAEQREWHLAPRRVRVFTDYREMLAACHAELDLVIAPTPIPLHAEMHAAATAHGLPVYVEKPPTLDYLELERMIEADRRARSESLVGFNFIIERPRLRLKERLLGGEFGAILEANLAARWPRPASYFTRNDWAGRLMKHGRVVLDSCLGNAMAHFVHNLLFWAGESALFSWAQLATVRAELYRAHAIEGADTFFVEAATTRGVTLRFAVSHACAGPSTHCETVRCERASIRYAVGSRAEIHWNDGSVERLALEPFDPLLENHLDYLRYLRGDTPRPATTLADSRPFVSLNDLAHVSSGCIGRIPEDKVGILRDEKEQQDYFVVAEMERTQEDFLTRGSWPGASGWHRNPGAVVTPADLPRFHEVVRAMAGQ